jgi:hypothetical protein
VLAQPSGSRPEMRDLFYETNMKGWGPELVKRRPDITMEMVDKSLAKMYRLPDARTDPAGCTKSRVTVKTKVGVGYSGASVCRRHGGRDARAKGRSENVSVERAQ